MDNTNYPAILDKNLSEILNYQKNKVGWDNGKIGKYIQFSTKKLPSIEFKLGKLEGVIPVNQLKAQQYYSSHLESQTKCRDMVDFLKLIEVIDQNTSILLFRTKPKFVVSARELLLVQGIRQLSKDSIVVFRANLTSHPQVSLTKDVVRGEGIVYSIILTKISENETHIEVFFLMDPKGSIPTSIVNLMMEEQLDSFEKDISFINKISS